MSKKLTKKQLTAINLISKGLSARQAMLRAGYSEITASQPTKNLLSRPQVLSLVDTMKLTLERQDINGVSLANKLVEWFKNPNYKVSMGAYDRIAKIVGIEPSKQDLKEPIKRQITLTEYLQPNTQPIEGKPDTNHLEASVAHIEETENITVDQTVDPEELII
jgi:phage terminase small subunit